MSKTEIKSLVSAGKMLPLMEAFYTIQGEGFHKGTAAYFIRIGIPAFYSGWLCLLWSAGFVG